MGFNPLDAFDSSGGREAAQQGYSAVSQGLNRGFGQARQYGSNATNYLKTGQNKAIQSLNKGTQGFQGANQAFKNITDTGQAGVDYYGQLVGLGGGDPGQMQETLSNIPGFQFALDNALKATERQFGGSGQTGNFAMALQDRANDVASQNYFNYLSALNPYFQHQQAGASGLGNIAGQRADIAANKANVYQSGGRDLAGIQTGLGDLAYNTQAGIGQAGSDLAMNQYNADQSASGNFWNAILGLGNAAAGGVGAFTGAGGTF